MRTPLALLALVAAVFAARAEGLPRVVSLNLCVDQLVLDLADPAQIMGLSPYSRDVVRSYAARTAAHYPLLSGSAEEVLTLKPDIVLTGRYSRGATRAFLAARKVRQEEFDAATTLGDTRTQIARMGRLLGQEARAQARIAALDAAAARLKGRAGQRISILMMARRGYVAGKSSLGADLLALAGARNAGEALAPGRGGFASLEHVLALRPDALLLVQDNNSAEKAGAEKNGAEDQGSALLLHPALATLFPPERRLYLPERLILCGGPALAEAMDRLSEGLGRITPR